MLGATSGIGLAQERGDDETKRVPDPPPSSQPAVGPRIEVTPRTLDFGEVWEGDLVRQLHKIKNTGDAPLTIRLTTTCGCTLATQPESPLPPGQSTEFTITYNTRHKGKAAKRVILNTNDPTTPVTYIDVRGNVKPIMLFDPTNRIAFHDLETDSVESQTIIFTNNFDKPVRMKLRESANSAFDVRFKEVKEGESYELTIRTKPPLKRGRNSLRLTLETDMPKVPTYTVHAHAYVPMRAEFFPPRLFVTSNMTRPMRKTVQLNFLRDEPLKIVDIQPSIAGLDCELASTTSQPTKKTATHNLVITLPPFDEVPEFGATIEIFTDDERPQWQKLTLPVVKRQGGALQIGG
jgi:hypothetical protein